MFIESRLVNIIFLVGVILGLDVVLADSDPGSFVAVNSDSGSELMYLRWNLEWNRTYGGGIYDSARSVVRAGDGGYVLTGYTRSYGAGESDAWLVKVDNEGALEWNRTYGGVDEDEAWSVVATDDGGYVLTGNTESYGAGKTDAWLVKVDNEGVLEWSQTYGGMDDDEAWSVVATDDGGYVLTGNTKAYGAGKTDAWLVKVDNEGVLEWSQTYGGTGWDGGRCVLETGNDGYVLAGYIERFDFWCDAWLVKVDNEGILEWSQTYGGRNYDIARSVIQTDDGGYVLAGYTESYGSGKSDFWLMKVDNEGVLEWNRTYGGGDFEYFWGFVESDDGGYVLTGNTESYGAGKTDAWLVKVDNEGVLEWSQTYGGTGWDGGSCVLGIGNGSYILAGSTESFGTGKFDAWLLKVGLGPSSDLPVSDFSSDVVDGSGPLTVSFVDLSESIDGVVSWLWVFGDGSTSKLKNPNHTYTQIGTYTVSLTVTEEDGDSDVETKSRYITVPEIPIITLSLVWLIIYLIHPNRQFH